MINKSSYLFLLSLLFLCTSCLSSLRVTQYDFSSSDIPEAFDSCKIAFVSDLHYKSLLKKRGLKKLTRKLSAIHPDLLLLGGDYQEGCQYVDPLFDALGKINAPLGRYAVLGNNDYERCYEAIKVAMSQNDIHLLEHETDSIFRDGDFILLSGVRNPFDLANNGVSPTAALNDDDFVIMLVHTPDYAEDVVIEPTDLVLAGHTHGGQVRILGYAPFVPSRYGKRFVYGLKQNTSGIPMIITSGVGTSRVNLRLGARAEIVEIILLSKKALVP